MSSGNLTRNAVRDALAGRSYVFALHGRQSTPTRSPRRRKRTTRREPYRVGSPNDFSLAAFANVERLHSVFRLLAREGGHGAGKDGLTYEEFGRSEVYTALRIVSQAIINRAYLPYESRLVLIPKGNDRYRELRLQRIICRVIAKAVQLALDPYWRSQLPGIGRSVWHVYADMQRLMRQHKAYVLTIDDVRDCFPSAPLDLVMECHRQHITQPDLLWLIETVIRGHEGPNRLVGLEQGSPYSPPAMESLLHTRLDTRLGAEWGGYPVLLRYVDNLTFVSRTAHEGYQALQITRDILAESGLTLKGEDGPPQDIRGEYDRTVLGLIPRWRNGQLTFAIPESSFEDLREGFIEALATGHPLWIAEKVASGWISYVGPAFMRSVMPSVIDRVISVARECGFTELKPTELIDTAQSARRQWVALCEGRGGRGCG